MYKYTPIQTENSVKKTKGILYCNHLPENGQIIGKVDLSDAIIDKNAEACLCVNETDYTVMPMEAEDDANKMKGFIPVSDKNSPDIYYLAIEKIHRLPLWICGLVPLTAVSIVALSVGIPAFLRPENKPQIENNPVIVADNDVTPTPIPTPARETIAPSATETPQAAQEDTTSEKKEDRIPDKGKDQIAVVPVADIKTPAPTEAPKVEEDTKKNDDSKTTSTPKPTVTPAPTTTPHAHTYVVEEQEATCTEDGYYRVTCSVCGEVLADHVCKKRGHNMYMVDPEDNTANIICPVFKCNRCDYTESTNHTHNWIAKGYENMTYPDGGDAVYVCATCLNKKTDHCDAVPGMYDEAGTLMYTYNELEDQFNWNLSTTPAKDIMDAHAELGNGRILLLPSWQHLSEVAAESGADCGLIKGGSGINTCFQNSTLSKVILPDDCNDFGNWFCGSNVVELELPDSITDYKGYSVSGANKLQTLKLSAGAPDLSNFKAQGNTALKEIIFPEGIEKLGNSTFAGNSNLKTVKLPSTLTDIGRSAFAASVIESLEIPANVKEIDSRNHSLAGMSKLKTLVLNDGVEKIDSYSFSSLSALENVYIPKSVTEMGTDIFSGLDNLKNVTFQEGLTVIGDNLFQGCANLREIIIPNSIKNIPDNLFTGVANLNLIILPEELDSIGGNGLFSCGQNSDELKIIMPTTVKEWRSGAAFSSPKLKEIVLPGNVDFPIGLINNGCGLEKVVITSEPNSIAYGAFGNLHNADIYYYGSKESVEKYNADAGNKDVFFLTDNNNQLHYMTGNPPTREDQMNGIDYNSLEEVTTQSISSEIPAAEGMSLPTVVSLPVTKEMIDTNISESTDNTKETKSPKSVSDGDAK